MNLTITTVERTALELDNVTQVTLPTQEGELTMLPNHVPLVVPLGMGEVTISYDGDPHPLGASPLVMFVDGGVLQFSNNMLELLTSLAEHADELDEAKIDEARRKAERLLEEKPVDIDLAKIEASLQRELMRLKLVRKQKINH